MHPALMKGPLFQKTHPVFHFFTKTPHIFHFFTKNTPPIFHLFYKTPTFHFFCKNTPIFHFFTKNTHFSTFFNKTSPISFPAYGPGPSSSLVISGLSIKFQSSFLSRDAMHARYILWPCVCLCLSQVGVLIKRLNTGSHKQKNTIAHGL